MCGPATKSQSPYAEADKQLYLPINNSNYAHTYNLSLWIAMASNQ